MDYVKIAEEVQRWVSWGTCDNGLKATCKVLRNAANGFKVLAKKAERQAEKAEKRDAVIRDILYQWTEKSRPNLSPKIEIQFATRPCMVMMDGKEHPAIFHRWIDEAEFSGGHPNVQLWLVLGIVELHDGTVMECYPSQIQFTDCLGENNDEQTP